MMVISSTPTPPPLSAASLDLNVPSISLNSVVVNSNHSLTCIIHSKLAPNGKGGGDGEGSSGGGGEGLLGGGEGGGGDGGGDGGGGEGGGEGGEGRKGGKGGTGGGLGSKFCRVVDGQAYVDGSYTVSGMQ